MKKIFQFVFKNRLYEMQIMQLENFLSDNICQKYFLNDLNDLNGLLYIFE